MKILKTSNTPIETVIEETLSILQRGGLVVYPTETVYGVGVDATNPSAVKKLLTYKSRREGKPLSIAVNNQKMARKYVEVNKQAQKLYTRFLPGPFTIISQGLNNVAPGVESEFGTLGIRIPDYDLILQIIEKYNKPITATSANSSGKKRPYTIQDIFDNLSEKQKNLIDLVIDAGTLPKNLPSTVIDTTLSTPIMVRAGDNNFEKNTKTTQLISHSDDETQKIAGKLLLKNWNEMRKNGLIIGLNGNLGVGKTIFTKGSAKFLQIKETITSPTYSYINEYDYLRHGAKGKLYHLDVWKIDSPEGYELLEIPKLVTAGNVVIIEWWEQVEKYLTPDLRKEAVVINMSEGENGVRIFSITV